jgi:hypothetical protein
VFGQTVFHHRAESAARPIGAGITLPRGERRAALPQLLRTTFWGLGIYFIGFFTAQAAQGDPTLRPGYAWIGEEIYV